MTELDTCDNIMLEEKAMKEYDEYLEVLKNKSPKTLLIYSRYLNMFLDRFNIKFINDIKKIETKQLRSFRDEIAGNESTKNLAMRIIKAFYNFLYRNEYIETINGIGRLETLKEPKKVKRFLTGEEKVQLIKAGKYADVRAMLALLVYEGLRRDEAVNLKKSDYENGYILINGKGNRQRRMKMNPVAKGYLDEYLSKRTDDCEYLFVSHRSHDGKFHKISGESVRIQVKTTCERAGIDPVNISPHTLRHTFISGLVNDGINMIHIRDLAGHSSSATTERYSHTQSDALDYIIDSQ